MEKRRTGTLYFLTLKAWGEIERRRREEFQCSIGVWWSAVSSPSGSGRSPAEKRHLVHFWSENAWSGKALKGCCKMLTKIARGTLLSQTDYATQKHSSHCWWKLKNFANHFYRTVLNIMISTAGANYALLTNCCRRQWTLALGSFNILLFYCTLY